MKSPCKIVDKQWDNYAAILPNQGSGQAICTIED